MISLQNPLLKDIRRALSRGALTAGGYAVAEGFHLLEEALASGREIGVVLAAESAHDTVAALLKGRPEIRLESLPDRALEKTASTETPQPVITLVRPLEWTLAQALDRAGVVTMLDGVQDPGNAGAIVRAAEAFGSAAALLLKGCVSPYNSKTLRASAGSLFRLPFVVGLEVEDVLAACAQRRLKVYASVASGAAIPVHAADLASPCVVAIGSEAHGVRDEVRAAASPISIPTVGVESLNAAMAAAVILYEASRQRRARNQ